MMDIKLFGRIRGMVMWVGWAPPRLSWKDGHYWGWRHCLVVGPWIAFWGLMTQAEIEADAAKHQS